MHRHSIAVTRYILATLPPIVLGVGFFVPAVGLFVPLLIILAIAGGFYRKRRFCASVCPRAAFLEIALPRISRRKALPAMLRGPTIRTGLCAFLIVCAIGQTARLWPDVAEIGLFFWAVCGLTFVFALAMSLVWKPRAWCAVCPVGALQDTIAVRIQKRGAERKE